MYPNVQSNTIYSSQDMKAILMPINTWIDNDDVGCDNVILLSHKKEWNSAIYSNMDGPREYYAYWNLKEVKERQVLQDINDMWNLKYNTTECICKI